MLNHQSEDKCKVKLHQQTGKNPEASENRAIGTRAGKRALSHIDGGAQVGAAPGRNSLAIFTKTVTAVWLPGIYPTDTLTHL